MYSRSFLTGSILVIANTLWVVNASAAVTLTRGTSNVLSGDLGDVHVNHVTDMVSITGYLDDSGLVDSTASPIDARRVQYDVLNQPGNGTVFEFRVDYAPGVEVIGAADPEGFYTGSGQQQTYWGGLPYAEFFDNGFGTYDYDLSNGSEWEIDYQSDHVTWRQNGNGFFADSATGDTNFGFNPTFALYFAPETDLGMLPAGVSGFDTTGNAADSFGTTLTAVPVPAAVWFLGSGLIALAGLGRRQGV